MNRFLLDTNVLLWYFWGSAQINPVRELIEADEVDVFFSIVSLWEAAIKSRNGKLTIDIDEFHSYAVDHAFRELPLTSDCMKAYLELPTIHKDPFDHMLLAQAITSPMRFITGDAILEDYSSLVMVI